MCSYNLYMVTGTPHVLTESHVVFWRFHVSDRVELIPDDETLYRSVLDYSPQLWNTYQMLVSLHSIQREFLRETSNEIGYRHLHFQFLVISIFLPTLRSSWINVFYNTCIINIKYEMYLDNWSIITVSINLNSFFSFSNSSCNKKQRLHVDGLCKIILISHYSVPCIPK